MTYTLEITKEELNILKLAIRGLVGTSLSPETNKMIHRMGTILDRLPIFSIPPRERQREAQDARINQQHLDFIKDFEQGQDINTQGGKQTKLSGDLTLLPPQALLEISKVLKSGAEKYGIDNWRKISVQENLNHALYHIVRYLMNDTSENHLVNASCRVLFALDVKERPLEPEGENGYKGTGQDNRPRKRDR